jgi:hypothetical protein
MQPIRVAALVLHVYPKREPGRARKVSVHPFGEGQMDDRVWLSSSFVARFAQTLSSVARMIASVHRAIPIWGLVRLVAIRFFCAL